MKKLIVALTTRLLLVSCGDAWGKVITYKKNVFLKV